MNWQIIYDLNPWIAASIIFIISLAFGVIVRLAFFKIVNYYAAKSDQITIQSLRNRLGKSLFLFIPLSILRLALESLYPEQFTWVNKILEVAIVVSIALLVAKLIYVLQDVLFYQYDLKQSDNLKARKVHTQIIYLRKIAMVIVAILAISIILLSFDSVRKYGATMLTSAGVAGIIIGFAAQKTLANLMAGIQIAFTQPIRIDDAVVVEGEWGWVEEINLTYVVIKIWDMRRLVLPITYFTENPFQNWTRSSAQLLGAVYLYLDYKAPLEQLRNHFDKILENTNLWDKTSKAFQVTDSSEKTMTVRMLMTAKNSPEAYDLRCYVREEMLKYIQAEHPEGLPKTRAMITEKE